MSSTPSGPASSPPDPVDVVSVSEAAPAGAPTASSSQRVARGGLWGLLAQAVPLVINLLLTPYVIHGLGVSRYGLFLFLVTFSSLIGSFDGGLTGSAQRYFAIFAGRDDRVATTRLFLTLILLATSVGVVVSGLMWFLSPLVAGALHMTHDLLAEATFMLRTVGLLVGLALVRGIPVGLLQARQRFALTNLTSAAVYNLYVIGIILTVQHHWGLRGVALSLVANQAAATLVVVSPAFQYLDRTGASLYKWGELREFLTFSGRLQVVGWANLFLSEMDGLLIGFVQPIRQVAVFNAGATFANELQTVPVNALAPLLSVLGGVFARDGEKAMLAEFGRLQAFWMRIAGGWCAVGAGAAYFGLVSWLGPGFRVAGIIAVIGMFDALLFLGMSVASVALTVTGRPGLVARAGSLMVVVNVLLTIPLVFVGPIGVAAATLLGQVVAAAYLARRLRALWGREVHHFLFEVPWLAAVVAGTATVVLELAISGITPAGAPGLLMRSIPAGVCLAGYAAQVFGMAGARESLRMVRLRLARRRSV